IRQQEQGRSWTTVDPLFREREGDPNSPPVRFVAATGEYEAGAIARRSADLLPPDAEQIVLQLLYWRPGGPRLIWLSGELLNARGDIENADRMLDFVYSTQKVTSVAELRQHHHALREAVDRFKIVKPYRRLMLQALAPSQEFGAPVVGDLAHASGWEA